MTTKSPSAAQSPRVANNGAGEGASQSEDAMNATEQPTGPHVYRGIAAVMSVMAKEGISKDRRSGDGGGPKFQFRGIDDVYNALSSAMSDNGLMMLPRMAGRSVTERTTKSGGAMFYTVVEAEFDLVSAVDGSKHTIRTFGEAMDSSDKSTNKAMSAAFKYAAMQAFCIPTEGDNDADATTHEVRGRQADADAGPSAAAQFAADQLRQTKTKDEFTHFWETNKAGLREQLNDGDYAHVISVMRTEAKRFAADKPAEKSTANDFPGDTPFDKHDEAA